MEITSEINGKVFAAYIGQDLRITRKSGENVRVKLTSSILDLLEVGKDLLFLKPLSAISDEDAIGVYSLINPKSLYFEDYEKISMVKDEWVKNKMVLNTAVDNLFAFQHLQSKGYDLPNHHLGGKTLFESRLCIYE